MTTRELECLLKFIEKKDDIEMPPDRLGIIIEELDSEPDVFEEVLTRLVI